MLAVRHISHISAQSNFDLAHHRYLNTRVLVQGSSIVEFVEIAMYTFDSHVLQEVGAVLS